MLAYARNPETTVNAVFAPYSKDYIHKHFRKNDSRGHFHTQPLTAQGTTNGYSGMPWRDIDPTERGLHWVCLTALPEGLECPDDWSAMTTQERLDWLHSQDMIYFPERGTMPRFKRYLSTTKGVRVADVMTDIPGVQGAHRLPDPEAACATEAHHPRVIKRRRNGSGPVLRLRDGVHSGAGP